MNLKNATLSFVAVVCLTNCVSPPKTDLCSIDYDSVKNKIYASCSSPERSKDDYELDELELLGFQCISPKDFAEIRAYLKHIIKKLN